MIHKMATSKTISRTSIPWDRWLLRFIASDVEEAFNDLIWSVGGSPPYGGVSYEEAEAVYDLLEQFVGPGQAPEQAYKRVRGHIKNHPERQIALDILHIQDRIASAPESLTERDIETGLTMSQKVDNPGIRAYFLALKAQLRYQEGEIPEAKQLILEALNLIYGLANDDGVYLKRAMDYTQNAIAFIYMDGDVDTAQKVENKLSQLMRKWANVLS